MMLRSRSALSLRGLAAIAVAALIPAVAGCEAGSNAPTQQWHQPTPGATALVNQSIKISNMFVLGPRLNSTLAPGASAGLFLALSNIGTTPDKLVSVSAPGTAASVRLPAGGVSLATRQTVYLQGPEPKIILTNLSRALRGGQDIRLVLTFQKAGSEPIQVPVMPKSQSYATFSPAPATPPSGPRARGAAASPAPSSTR